MKNHLAYIEDNLRSIVKRYKNIKFSLGMVILFLMMGVGAFSEEVENTSIAQRENIKNSVENLNSKLKDFKLENQKQSKLTVFTFGILKLIFGLTITGFILKFGKGGGLIFITGSIINGTPLSTTCTVLTNP